MDFKTCFSIVYYRNFYETLLKWKTNLYIDIHICVRNSQIANEIYFKDIKKIVSNLQKN